MKRKNLMSGQTLIGVNVYNPAYEELGEIDDVMIDPVSGNIVYAVLTFGGFMGFGEKYFAIPWEAFFLDTQEDDRVILNIPKEKLEQAPGFDKDNVPLTGQWEFVDKIYRHYGYKPYTATRPVGKLSDVPTSTVLRGNSGLGNSGEPATFGKGRVASSRIKESGIS